MSHERSPGAPRTLPAVDRALANLAELADLVVGLALLRDPEAARPWRAPSIDAYRRAELDADARLERRERNGLAPGEHCDAARPDVLDVLSEVLRTAEELAFHLSRAARCPVMRPAAADADPRPYLARAAACLPAAVLAWGNGDEIAWWAADTARGMLRDVTTALALMHDGQRLNVVCPWCGGGLTGARTWRVRDLFGFLRCTHGNVSRQACPDCPQHIAIVCEGELPCEPPSKDVGTWWRGRPAWPLAEWEWLAKRINAAERAA